METFPLFLTHFTTILWKIIHVRVKQVQYYGHAYTKSFMLYYYASQEDPRQLVRTLNHGGCQERSQAMDSNFFQAFFSLSFMLSSKFASSIKFLICEPSNTPAFTLASLTIGNLFSMKPRTALSLSIALTKLLKSPSLMSKCGEKYVQWIHQRTYNDIVRCWMITSKRPVVLSKVRLVSPHIPHTKETEILNVATL